MLASDQRQEYKFPKDMCDELVKCIVHESIHEHTSWLKETFRMCQQIKEHRNPVSDYGFEWAIQTAIGDYLIAKAEKHRLDRNEIRLNQRYSDDAVRPDICFVSGDGKIIIIELKTVVKCDLSYTRDKDLKKPFPNGSIVYFLIVSYPHENASPPRLDGTDLVLSKETLENFRLILLRKSG